MSTFRIMLMCLLYLAFVGLGLNCLLTALSSRWRGEKREQWRLYNFINFFPHFLDSFFGRLGIVRSGFIRPRPFARIDFDEKSAKAVYYVFAATFLILGIGGLVMLVYSKMA